MLKEAVFVCLMAAGLVAQAQVVKCVDRKSGAVTYSDGGCAANQSGTQILDRKSPEELAMERQRYDEGMRRKWAEQQRDAQIEAQRTANQPRYAGAPQAQGGGGYECRLAQQELETVSSITTLPRDTKAARVAIANQKMNAACNSNAPNPAPQPVIVAPIAQVGRIITNCNPGFCYDNVGTTYSRSGNLLINTQTGRTCSSTGSTVICN